MTPEAQAELDLFAVHLREQHVNLGKVKTCRFCFPDQAPCPRCGLREAHFVPPSLGEAGFYACTIAPGGRND